MKKIFETLKRKWAEYLLEMIVITMGILGAFLLNTWNEDLKIARKELQLLINLKNDLTANIVRLEDLESRYLGYEERSDRAINLFYEAKSVKDFIEIDSLFITRWIELRIKKDTYMEMLNTGSLYTLRSESLKNMIGDYYTRVEGYKRVFFGISGIQNAKQYQQDVYNFKFMIDEFKNPRIDLNQIDTSWINNPSSPTYIALNRHLKRVNMDGNKAKRRMLGDLLKMANELSNEITKELQKRR